MIVPVPTAHVGSTIVNVGVAGAPGAKLMTMPDDAGEIHPAALVTVKLYVPVASPEMVVLAPVPAIDPGLMVHVPAGRPLRTTLPVATAHVG